MTPSKIVLVYKRLNVTGMAIWPFIILADRRFKNNKTLINHELIHHKQQLELLILPFYILYLFNYLFNLAIFKNHKKAYEEIIFEKEAYDHDKNLDYLKERAWYCWMKYLKLKN